MTANANVNKETAWESFRTYKDLKDQAKELSTQLDAVKEKAKALEKDLIDYMQNNDQQKVSFDNVGSFSFTNKEKIFWPAKTKIYERKLILSIIRDALGQDTAISNITLNFNFLTSLQKSFQDDLKDYYEMIEKEVKAGDKKREHILKYREYGKEHRQKVVELERELMNCNNERKKLKLEKDIDYHKKKGMYRIPGITEVYIESKLSFTKK